MTHRPKVARGASALPELPEPWSIQLRLSCASLCGYDIPPYVARNLLDLRHVSLLELYLYLQRPTGHSPLATAINTHHRRERVTAAYCAFSGVLSASRPVGRAHSKKLAWIIPEDYLSSGRRLRKSHIPKLITGIVHAFDDPRHAGKDIVAWLPWLSLSMANNLRRWRSPRINAVRRTMFKLAAALAAGTNSFYPWSSNYPKELSQLPIYALCQYETSRLTVATVRTLDHLGLTTIADLRCLHPDAVTCAKLKGQPLLKLYRHLHT